MNLLDVVTFGEAMVLFIADQIGELHEISHFTRNLAGAETNVAIGFARLGYAVGFASKVGDDSFGKYIIEALQGEGVDTSKVQVDDRYLTGFQLKSKVESGDPRVQYYRRGSAASMLSGDDFDPTYFLSARHLHLTGIPLAISRTTREYAHLALTTMKSAKKTISFDPNLRPTLWNSSAEMVEVINKFAVQADFVLPGLAEGLTLTGFDKPQDIAAYYLDQGVKGVIVKLGPRGAYYRSNTEELFVPGYVAEVVDTVGAGDGFAVGVVSGILNGLPMLECLVRGNAIGTLAVMSQGDSDGLPTSEQLKTFIESNNRKFSDVTACKGNEMSTKRRVINGRLSKV